MDYMHVRIALFISLVYYCRAVSFDDVSKTLQSLEDMLNKLKDDEAKAETNTYDITQLKTELKNYIDDRIGGYRKAASHLNADRILHALRIEKRLRKDVTDKVKLLEQIVAGKETEIATLQDKFVELRKDVMKKVNENCEDSRVTELKTTIHRSMEDVYRRIGETVDKCDLSLKKLGESLTKSLDNSYTELDEKITSTCSKLAEKFPEKVAFSARVSSSYADMKPWEILVFSTVLLNAGKAYSGTTGKFTAPVKGVYVFDVHIVGRSNTVMEMALQKNNDNILYLYVEGKHRAVDSGAVTMHLHPGDTISVVKHGPWGNRPFYVHAIWSSFTGYLLYED